MLPWYRAPGYKGKMSEADKRKLDALRMLPKHPTATGDDLPEEVQAYINRLECDVYGLKQDKLTNATIGFSVAGPEAPHA